MAAVSIACICVGCSAHCKSIRIIGWAEISVGRRPSIARRKDRCNPSSHQSLQIRFKGQVTPRITERPRVVDNIRRVCCGWIAIWVQEPLKALMNGSGGGSSAIVKNFHCNPLRLRGYPNPCAATTPANNDSHGPGAMSTAYAGYISRRRMLTIRIIPTVAATTPLGGQIRVGVINPRIHIGNHNSLPIKTQCPHIRCVDNSKVQLWFDRSSRNLRRWRRGLNCRIQHNTVYFRQLAYCIDHCA